MTSLQVVRAGPLTTVQDLGRPGLAHLGIPRSGALDRPALQLANRLVGNPEGAATLEVTLTGAVFRPDAQVTVAVTGATTAISASGERVGFAQPVRVAAGTLIKLGPARSGVRSYLAVAGGIDVPPVLGSRATDTLSGLGPAALRDGDVLPIGQGRTSVSLPAPAAAAVVGGPDTTVAGDLRDAVVRVKLGPRHDRFTRSAVATFLGSTYTVSPLSNRIGVRLTGPPLEREITGELPSEGVVLGAVQVPASGEPLVFLADHPTTGGYPVIGVVSEADLPVFAQARPGTRIRFTLSR
ncbi:MAG TPA: biotin-dependent carboxyltransferase family protein, partial [Micromonosporaceae bacterium]|jgi:biotin-dependent carboxylase-like uncharacterized protein|nr:biotin-dependent carboxyltransferase family protein [Micromonosporaceae bacterium]